LPCLLDPLRFKQVLSNLVSNAIKFTEHGQVRICVSLLDEGRTPALELEVRDSGIGIHPDDLQRLFNPFIRPTRTARAPAQVPGWAWPSAATCAT
jgi:two-component system sensor histidine kinase EvgS